MDNLFSNARQTVNEELSKVKKDAVKIAKKWIIIIIVLLILNLILSSIILYLFLKR